MNLPDEVSGEKGIATTEGTVVYNSKREDVNVSVQALKQVQDGMEFDGLRSLVTIENASAPKKYSFDFNLPDGYELVTAEELYGEDAEEGWIFIINEKSDLFDGDGNRIPDIMVAIEPAWAKDAKGNDVDTYFKLEGNTIIQNVNFNENTAFPVVADPSQNTKPKSKKVSSATKTCNINHNDIGLGSFLSGSVASGLTAAARTKFVSAIAAKIGSKFIPIVGVLSWAVGGYATVQSWRGYSYTKVTISYETWTYYKMQGGKWAQGYTYKGSVKLTPMK